MRIGAAPREAGGSGCGRIGSVRSVSHAPTAVTPPPRPAVMPGAEPRSVAGGAAGALLLHGFTGTPAAMRATADRLAGAGLGVEVPLLPGHGTAVEDLVPEGWATWAEAAERAYAALGARCRRVAVVGHSMGGTLACWLAQRHPEIAGIALVNPLVAPFPDDLLRAARELLESGTEIVEGSGPDLADPTVRYPTYDATPLAAFLSLCEGARAVEAGLARIRCPVLLVSSRQDHVVPPAQGDLLEASVSGPCTRIWLERSYHAAMVDVEHERVERHLERFVRAVTGGAADAGVRA